MTAGFVSTRAIFRLLGNSSSTLRLWTTCCRRHIAKRLEMQTEVFAQVSVRELQEEFLDELQTLKPYTQNKSCWFWGCEAGGPHDHGPRDTGPKEIRFCGCECHDGVPIFCSCWSPCCHQPRTPRAEHTPRPPIKPGKIGDFKKFTMPVIRTKD